MAKPQVTLTFAGDSTQLERSFDQVGASARTMGDDVGRAGSEVGSASDGFNRAGEAADAVDTKAMGFRDTMTGVQDSMLGASQIAKGNLFEGFLTLGMGVGDLASGFYNFLIPSIKAATSGMIGNAVSTAKATASSVAHRAATIAQTVATKAATVAQKALNLVLRANPIGIVITVLAALAAAIYVAYQRSSTFRAIVQGAFAVVSAAARAVGSAVQAGMNMIGGAIGWAAGRVSAGVGAIRSFFASIPGAVRGALSSAADWVSYQVGRIVGFFTGMPGRIRGAMSALGSAISSPFRSALNGLKRLWNSTVGRVSFSIPSWVPGVGGKGWSFPRMHNGGIVPGAPGTEQMAILQAGERVTPAGRAARIDDGGDEPITVNVMLSRDAIAGIAQVEIKKGNRLVKRAVMSGATRAATA